MVTERRSLEQHEDDCPLAPVECELSMFGCQVKMPRKEMPAHVQTNLTQHVSMLVASHAKLTLEHANLKLEMQKMKQDETMLLSTSAFCVPVRVTMKNVSQLKSTDTIWESPPFYSRPQGYKLRIMVHPNGSEEFKRKDLVIKACLLKGEYDEMLPFPVSLTVKVGPVTTEGLVPHTGTIDFVNATRVPTELESFKARTSLQITEGFISNWVNQILKDDSIQFQINISFLL